MKAGLIARWRLHVSVSRRAALGLAAARTRRGLLPRVRSSLLFLLSVDRRCTACTCWAACGSGARTTAKVLRGVEIAKVRLSVELCTVYWHYLLLVWLVLFAVLLHTHIARGDQTI